MTKYRQKRWFRRRKKETKAQESARIKRNHGCSRHVWYNSKRRKVKYFGDNLWLVYGGERQHRTYVDQERFACDCFNQLRAYDCVCCHIQAVRNKINELLGPVA